MHRFAFFVCLGLPLPVFANCTPPYHTLFACHIPERDAHAEFCVLADKTAHPDLAEGYYSYAVEAREAELYFETSNFRNKSYVFRAASAQPGNPPGRVTRTVGYIHDAYVYSFRLTISSGDRRPSDPKIMVHPSVQAFSEDRTNGWLDMLACAPETVVADLDMIGQ